MKQYNWKPVVKSLIETIQSAGFNLLGVNDGEDVYVELSNQSAVDIITSVDESWATFIDSNGVKRSVFIVLGNEPYETVCDYTYPKDIAENDPIQVKWENAIEEFSDFWETHACPLVKTA